MYEKYNIKFHKVVPYIGTWIETTGLPSESVTLKVVPYIGTWIETVIHHYVCIRNRGRTLYRYVD